MTILHNGVLVQDNVELTGPTAHGERPPYKKHAEKLAAAVAGPWRSGSLSEYLDPRTERVVARRNEQFRRSCDVTRICR